MDKNAAYTREWFTAMDYAWPDINRGSRLEDFLIRMDEWISGGRYRLAYLIDAEKRMQKSYAQADKA